MTHLGKCNHDDWYAMLLPLSKSGAGGGEWG
jgi:hypothetical protein